MGVKKKIVIASSLLLAAALEMFLWFPQFYLQIVIAWLVIMGVSIWLSIVESLFSRQFLNYSITPFFLTLSVFLFLSLIESDPAKQILLVGASLLYWVYLSAVATFNFDYANYQHPALENISYYTSVISLFFISILAYAAETLLGLQLWISAAILISIIAIMVHQSLWAARIKGQKNTLYILSMVVMMAEIFWSISFLPSNFYLQGFLVTIAYYCLFGLLKSNLLGIFSNKLLVRYLLLCGAAVAAVIATARWL